MTDTEAGMRERPHLFLCTTLVLLLAVAPCAFAMETAPPEHAVKTPDPESSARRYTVAYYESGQFSEFAAIFTALERDLAEHGPGRNIRFPERYHFSPGPAQPDSVYDDTARIIMESMDIDLVIAMGSVASRALLRRNNGKTPVICLAVDDPVSMGLVIPATGFPAAPNFVVDHVPDKWLQSITLMATVHSFKKIGSIAANTPEGRSYSNVDELLAVGRERGFAVVMWNHLDKAESVDSCRKGIEYLIGQGIDSMYIPALNCFDPVYGDPVQLFDLLHANKVKTYAKDGKVPVSLGALIGVSTQSYQATGQYYARRVMEILTGPRPLPNGKMSFEPKIYLNSATGRKLGITFPNSLLINVDGIYDDALPAIIERP